MTIRPFRFAAVLHNDVWNGILKALLILPEAGKRRFLYLPQREFVVVLRFKQIPAAGFLAVLVRLRGAVCGVREG